MYRPLAAELAPRADVLAVQYPGRQDRSDEPMTDLHTLADLVAEELTVHEVAEPVFFGHSMGALVAYEVALRLGQRGPSVLIVSGCRAPARYRPGTAHLRDDDELVQHLRALGGTSAELLDDPEMRALVLSTVRADYTACADYRSRSGPPLKCPVLALAGDRDPLATVTDVRAWKSHTTGDFRMESFSGGHFFPHTCLAETADAIRSALPEAARLQAIQQFRRHDSSLS